MSYSPLLEAEKGEKDFHVTYCTILPSRMTDLPPVHMMENGTCMLFQFIHNENKNRLAGHAEMDHKH